jgi:hypothetical protein
MWIMLRVNGVKTLLAASALAVTGWAGAASAATYSSCVGTGYDLSVHVPDAVGCEISDADQDFLNTNPLTVNEDGGFFDIDTWEFEGKIGEDLSGDGYADLTGAGDGEGQSGDYDLTSLFAGLTGDIMLVFKDGVGSLVGYTLSLDDLAGSWTTPFTCPPFESNQGRCNGFPKDVSHISVYSNVVAAIPLPAGGLLLVGALGALGLAKRRRRV